MPVGLLLLLLLILLSLKQVALQPRELRIHGQQRVTSAGRVSFVAGSHCRHLRREGGGLSIQNHETTTQRRKTKKQTKTKKQRAAGFQLSTTTSQSQSNVRALPSSPSSSPPYVCSPPSSLLTFFFYLSSHPAFVFLKRSNNSHSLSSFVFSCTFWYPFLFFATQGFVFGIRKFVGKTANVRDSPYDPPYNSHTLQSNAHLLATVSTFKAGRRLFVLLGQSFLFLFFFFRCFWL